MPVSKTAYTAMHAIDAAKDAVRFRGLSMPPREDKGEKGIEFASTTHTRPISSEEQKPRTPTA